jgi:hypothetical protein
LGLLNYFGGYPLLSKKMVRIRLITKIYEGFSISAHRAPVNSLKGKL